MKNIVTLKENKEKLIGDQLQEVLKKAQIDRLMGQIEKLTGVKCNCAGRQQKLNQMHARLKRMLSERNATD